MRTILFFLAVPMFSQIFGGSTQASKVVNNACTSGQVPTFDANGRLTGCGSGGGGSITIENNNVAVPSRSALSLIPGIGITTSFGDSASPSRTSVTFGADTAVLLTQSTAQAGTPYLCSGTGTAGAQTCSMVPALGAYTSGQVIQYRPGTTNVTTQTIAINGLTAASILRHDGSALSAGDLTSGRQYPITYDGTAFRLPPAGGSTVSALTPYLSIGGLLYLDGMYPATLPPTAGGGGWTVRGGSGTPTLTTTTNGALRLVPDSAGTVGNYQWQARQIGATRQLTLIVRANVAQQSACSIGVWRNGVAGGVYWEASDNRQAGTAAAQGWGLLTTGAQFLSSLSAQTQFVPDATVFVRIAIAGGNVTAQKSSDFGLTWVTQATRTQADTFGGAVANTDEWLIGGVTRAAHNPACTILSWEAI